jgi:hypothetical protein
MHWSDLASLDATPMTQRSSSAGRFRSSVPQSHCHAPACAVALLPSVLESRPACPRQSANGSGSAAKATCDASVFIDRGPATDLQTITTLRGRAHRRHHPHMRSSSAATQSCSATRCHTARFAHGAAFAFGERPLRFEPISRRESIYIVPSLTEHQANLRMHSPRAMLVISPPATYRRCERACSKPK